MAEESEATQYLTFVLDEEIFAVGVARVREIRNLSHGGVGGRRGKPRLLPDVN